MWNVYVFTIDGELFIANKLPLSREDAIGFSLFLDDDLRFLLWPSDSSLPAGLRSLLL